MADFLPQSLCNPIFSHNVVMLAPSRTTAHFGIRLINQVIYNIHFGVFIGFCIRLASLHFSPQVTNAGHESIIIHYYYIRLNLDNPSFNNFSLSHFNISSSIKVARVRRKERFDGWIGNQVTVCNNARYEQNLAN